MEGLSVHQKLSNFIGGSRVRHHGWGVLKAVLLLAIFASCAHKSGKYVKWEEGNSIEDVAKANGIPVQELRAANQGRAPGEWVFVPQRRGLIYFNQTHYEESTGAYLSSGTFLWPVPASKDISSEFGKRWGKKHDGIDIPARIGSHILAAHDGKVIYSGSKIGGYGNLTIISHDDGFFTVYAHAKKNFTKRGQKVHRGEVIGQVGMTGRSTGPHLHFEIRRSGESLDPRDYLAMQ